ncbi:hypothetical protein M1D80_10995 [Phyllobacteriaceae bacterium JZ32]
MHQILQYAGAAISIIAIAIGAFSFHSGGAGGTAILISVALPTLVAGALLYCFGAIVDHLAAIRKYQARQTAIFEEIQARQKK